MSERLAVGAYLETPIAAAATIDLGAVTTLAINISSGGGSSCTSLGTKHNCWRPLCRSSVAFTLVNGASLITGTGANIVVAAGDTWSARSDTAGVWRIRDYIPGGGFQPLDANLTAIAALSTTGFGRGLLTKANAAALATAAGVGTGDTPDFADIVGTVTNDSAASGNIGEYVSSEILIGSAVSLTTNTPANLTSISLTAGDWNVAGVVNYIPGSGTTVTRLQASLSTTTGVADATTDRWAQAGLGGTAIGLTTSLRTGQARFSLSGTTTVYLVSRADFAVSTMTMYGRLFARRAR